MSTHSIVNQRQNLPRNQVSDNKENIQLIWLDGNINNSSDCTYTKSRLIELNPAAQFYSDFDLCVDLIRSIKDEQIFLIVSGALVRPILSQVNNHRPLIAIIIFCANRQHHELLLNQYDKIIGIYTDQNSLVKSISEKMNLLEKQTMAFNLFDQKQKSMKDLSKESASFLWHQMLIYVLKQIPEDQQSKRQMITLCRDYYQNNQDELNKINEFQRTYKCECAIEWYTDESFVYKLLNKALRTENIELLYMFRFFIIDLCAAIDKESQDLKNKGILKLYRGTQIPNEELEKLKQNIGQIISTNGFFSTSRNLKVSLKFARSNQLNNDYQTVLFEIQADSSLKSLSFADVESRSKTEGEAEVLFNLNSLFKIHSVVFDPETELWKIRLQTTDEGSEKVDEYLRLAEDDIKEYSAMIYFGRLLLNELGQINQAEKYFQMLLESLPSDHKDIASVYNNIGNVYREKGELTLALKNYDIGYDIRRKRLPANHPHIADSLNNIGLIYRRKGDYDRALNYYKNALTIREEISSNDNLQKAEMIENIGLIYNDKNEFDSALYHLSRAVKMYKHVLPDQHPDIASCLGNLGAIYRKKGDFNIAVDYYHQQLNMEEQCLPFDHPSLSLTLESIVGCYKKMNEIERASKFCYEKLLDQKERFGENHCCVGRTLKIIGDIFMENDQNKSLKYYKQALSILEGSNPPDYKAISVCLKYMAAVYGSNNQFEDALKCLFKALDLSRRSFSSDNIDIANNLYLIGTIYKKMKNPSEAYRYYNECLLIYSSNYGPEHDAVKKVEREIKMLYVS